MASNEKRLLHETDVKALYMSPEKMHDFIYLT